MTQAEDEMYSFQTCDRNYLGRLFDGMRSMAQRDPPVVKESPLASKSFPFTLQLGDGQTLLQSSQI